MPTIFKQIMAVWLVVCTVSISAQKTTYTLVKNPAESMSMASVDDAFSSLSYSHVDLNVDADGKEDLYIRLGEESQNPRIFLFEKSATSPFSFVTIAVDTRTTISDDPGVKTVRQVDTQIALAVVQDDFEITAAVTAPNTLNSYSFSTPSPTAVALLGRPDNQCKYTQTITEKTTYEFSTCPILIKIMNSDGSSDTYTASLDNLTLKDLDMQNAKPYDYPVTAALYNASNEHIGYFRFYLLAGAIEFLDLNKELF